MEQYSGPQEGLASKLVEKFSITDQCLLILHDECRWIMAKLHLTQMPEVNTTANLKTALGDRVLESS